MTKYEDNSGRVSDQQIKSFLHDEDLATTKDPEEAIYILRDGTLVSGEFAYGGRSEDHRCMQGLISESKNMYRNDEGRRKFWAALQGKTEMVMLVPESSEALKAKGQSPTNKQRQIINQLGYSLSDYTEKMNLTKINTRTPKKATEQQINSAKAAALRHKSLGLGR
ncbi:hypothetical protein [Lactobacillus sp. ESL0681]|uniref:hypothetical protein n=1 Tax=Lactobacillus sp. ESL0681 TaxID=2983211 RepID=UPI0023F8E12C|nr:hypothetical protein [Lactobacillus sp. ESL0681]WEV41283.1 hypothetical protein OZX59_09455 [Lactobacillus sp. ESL0681]